MKAFLQILIYIPYRLAFFPSTHHTQRTPLFWCSSKLQNKESNT